MTEAARIRREKAEKQKETAAAASVSESGSTAESAMPESDRCAGGPTGAEGNEAQPANDAASAGEADIRPKSSGVGTVAADADAVPGGGAQTKSGAGSAAAGASAAAAPAAAEKPSVIVPEANPSDVMIMQLLDVAKSRAQADVLAAALNFPEQRSERQRHTQELTCGPLLRAPNLP